METTLELTHANRVATISLVPPDERKPPTLDFEVFDRFEAVMSEIRGLDAAEPQGLAAVVLRSRSCKFFCAGANINVLKTLNAESMEAWIRRGHDVLDRLEGMALPVIAVVEGYALGGGLELALACDFIYASEGAQIGHTEGRLGFVTGWLGGYRLSRRIGVPRAKELIYTARILSAAEAHALGIVNFTGTRQELEARLCETLDMIRQNSRATVREMKHIFNDCYDEGRSGIAEQEVAASRRCIVNKDTLDRLRSFLERRK